MMKHTKERRVSGGNRGCFGHGVDIGGFDLTKDGSGFDNEKTKVIEVVLIIKKVSKKLIFKIFIK